MYLLIELAYQWLADLVGGRRRELAATLLLIATASCVPLKAVEAPASLLPSSPAGTVTAAALTPAEQAPLPEPMQLEPVSLTQAALINAGIPISSLPNPRPDSIILRAASVSDQLRSLQCLAEAVYYEARSESEDGQRAVAQVVLNRVRSPAYPGSVCGVVYQGPMRAGGGCQFTFTCDGSLRAAPSGTSWTTARRIAAEALAGSVYAPVGYATHYHTQQVVPTWAFKLVKAAVVGSHSFYRMQGGWGQPAAFSRAYAGREPAPSTIMASRLPAYLGPAAPKLASASLYAPGYATGGAVIPSSPPDFLPPVRADNLPVSQVRDEYRNSGRVLGEGEAQP